MNTVGCADEGLWIFSLEDSKKRLDMSVHPGSHPIPNDELYTHFEAVAANNVALQQYGQKWFTAM